MPKLPIFTATYDIYEAAGEYGISVPVVRHVFFASSPEKAERLAAAHRTTDVFFRGCSEEGQYGQIICPTSKVISRIR